MRTDISPERLHIIKRVKSAVCDVFEISIEQLNSRSQKPSFAEPRFVARALSRELTGASIKSLGAEFECHHGCICQSTDRASELQAVDPEFRSKFEQVKRLVLILPVEAMHQRIDV